MRNLLLLGLFAVIAIRAYATDRITIEQLEQMLDANKTVHHSDDNLLSQLAGEPSLINPPSDDIALARRIDGLELSERLTEASLQQIVAKYEPSLELEWSLALLADRSSFLDPPLKDLPVMQPPDSEAQQRMVEASHSYVFHTLMRLPDFFATRSTSHFEEQPSMPQKNGLDSPTGLRLDETLSGEITFHDGVEYVVPEQSDIRAVKRPQIGLESWGEFGTEPATVFIDTAKTPVTFHHWEKTSAGLAAVYRYSVPKSDSHYEVNYSCQANKRFHEFPSYHGSLSIDPTSGAIFRITLEADSKKGDPISHVGSVIEYGPITLGDRSYIFPLRSLIFMTEEANACAHLDRNRHLDKPIMMLNRMTFTHYHRLGSTMTILSTSRLDSDSNPDEGAAHKDSGAPTSTSPAVKPGQPPSVPAAHPATKEPRR